MYKEIIRQTTYMLNHHPVSALISPPSAGKSAIIREQICSQEHLSEENAAAMVFDIKPFANGADTLTAQFAAALRQEVKEPVFLDLSFMYEYRSRIPSEKYKHHDIMTEVSLRLKF